MATLCLHIKGNKLLMHRSVNILRKWLVLLMVILCNISVIGQLSPGDLSEPHSHLEGMSNCTLCHTLGQKISNQKCLDCHELLAEIISSNKGYHSSFEVKRKECVSCHSDHHGREFNMIRFDKENFNHDLTGYSLEGKHKEEDCINCHQPKNYTLELKKENSYLGLSTRCLSCHDDQHQGTLDNDCAKCHDFNGFTPASVFNHNNSDYPLLGKHREVECADCHLNTVINGIEIVNYSNIPHSSCTDCHEDIHDNKFGNDCQKCHSVFSFNEIKETVSFNHNLTGFPLEGRHSSVDCKDCHTNNVTDPVAHVNCTDCHDDFHKGQFMENNKVRDCKDCHTVNGFQGSLFTIEMHRNTKFSLEGAHIATPCFVCHKDVNNEWKFRNLGINCADCHDDVHKGCIDSKYYPEKQCRECHGVERWNKISFDHSITGYELLGEHKNLSCRDCHFQKTIPIIQRFNVLNGDCLECHLDVHQGQFQSTDNTITCLACHQYNNWDPTLFNHDNTNFPLDGKHKDVSCDKCHKEVTTNEQTYTLYKLKDYRCENCH